MIDKQVFTLNPFKSAQIAIAATGAIMLLLLLPVIIAILAGFRDDGLFIVLGIVPVIFIFISLIILLSFSFIKRRTVVLTSSGCELSEKTFWNKSRLIEQIAWSEIAETSVTMATYRTLLAKQNLAVIYRFEIAANGSVREVYEKENFNRNFEKIISLVNQATPQLPYIWARFDEVNNREVIETVGNYLKVKRI